VAGAAAVWEAAGLDDDRGSSRSEVTTLQRRARLRAAEGRVEQALADLERCGQLEAAWRIRTPALSTWRSDAARLLAGLDRRAEAEALAREEIERCRAFGAPRPLAAALRAAAAAGPEAGPELLGEAVELLAESPARLDEAFARFELGAALRRAGRRAIARERLSEALELAVFCGATALATRAHDELVAAGARPRRDPVESRSNLTASELRVAGMAAEGMTNREIAQALFLTEKTIENHLRSVYRKLSIASRSQLARALPQPAAV
jgi:DNA-binding NarL/FixJ family response regulator